MEKQFNRKSLFVLVLICLIPYVSAKAQNVDITTVTKEYEDVDRYITVKIGESITLMPLEEFGISTWGTGLGVCTSDYYKVTNSNAFEIDSAEKETYFGSYIINGSNKGTYHLYWLTPVMTGEFTFTACIQYINTTGSYGSFTCDYVYIRYHITVNPEPAWAIFDSNSRSLKFVYQENKPEGSYVFNIHTNESTPKWVSYRNYIDKIIFEPSFAKAHPFSTQKWFYDCKNVMSITGMEYLNTCEVRDMSFMFYNCIGLTNIDVSHFNTSKVKTMRSMFYNCENLKYLDLSNFNTEKVETMYMLFRGCSSLEYLDVSHFNTNKVTTMRCLFWGCGKLTNIDVSSFDTRNVTDFEYIFRSCSSLKKLDLSSFDLSKATTTSYFVASLRSLEYLVLPSTMKTISNETFIELDSIKTITSLIVTPASVNFASSAIDNNVFNHAKLIVPTGTIERYNSHYGWMNFSMIEEQDNLNLLVERQKAWDAFFGHWCSATVIRNEVISKIGNKEYPWEQDSLSNAVKQWDSYYNIARDNGWISANNTDSGKASIQELQEWASHQGYYPQESAGDNNIDYILYYRYAVERGYKFADEYVKDANKLMIELKNAITEHKKCLDNERYLTCDKTLYELTIQDAEDLFMEISENSTNERRSEDEERIKKQIEDLLSAQAVFVNSGSITNLVSIDFSQNAVKDTDDLYYVEGTNGKMSFSDFETENTTANNVKYAIGYGSNFRVNGILHVGNGEGTVEINESNLPNDDEVIEVNFDLWFGKLSGKYCYVDLRNAHNEKVAGFRLNSYNGTLDYNDFNDTLSVGGTGMDVLSVRSALGSPETPDAGICSEINRSSFILRVNRKTNTALGTLKTYKGISEGKHIMLNKDLTDNKVAKIVIGSDYNNSERRCWFDNLNVYKYPAPPLIEGDVNLDGNVDVADVVNTVNYILGTTPKLFVNAAADTNCDNDIDISDIVNIINIILNDNHE